jgi:feruloyl esterase
MFSSASFLFLSLFSFGAVSATLNCSADSFAGLLPSNTTVTYAGPIAKYGKFTLNSDINITISNRVEKDALPICVLELNVVSSPNTSFNAGIMLPSNWNGRLFATGNPGFGGGIRWSFQYANLRYGPSVSVSTDTGHIGAPGDVDWAVNNPEGIIDWAHRSLHESVVLAKTIAAAYYGTGVAHSYYTACSNGGRQGLKEVQLYPEDFDGVLAGAPPWQITHLHPWAVQLGLWNIPVSADTHVLGYKLDLLQDLIMEQCDGQDGVVDKIIQDPYACNFSSAAIECPEGSTNTTSCFTGAEISTLSLIYNDWQASNGSLLFPRFPLSASPSRYAQISSAVQAPDHFGLEYLYGFVFNSTTWDWKDGFKGEETVDYASSLNTGDAAALDMDLSAYKSHGGKLIMYHGLADTTIPTGSSIEYVQGVNSTMGGIDDFMQLYLVPGMGHVSFSSAEWIDKIANKRTVW